MVKRQQNAMPGQDERERLKASAEQDDNQSWADVGTCRPENELLRPYIVSLTYSVGCLREQEARFITRAYPTVMTQLYFEFCGDLSEVRDRNDSFAFGEPGSNTSTAIEKRTYIKQGLGSWFDIHQLYSPRKTRAIKNLKVDLYPSTLYLLFQLSPQELAKEDLQLADLFGASTSSLMLEEMEAAISGKAMVAIVERYFADHIQNMETQKLLAQHRVPRLPILGDSLGAQALRYSKSERWLQKRYAQVYGMSFKQMQKNIQFHQVQQALSHAIGTHRPVGLTEMAHQFGYFDQAHFIKDFRRHTGMTPGKYLQAHVAPESLHLFYW